MNKYITAVLCGLALSFRAGSLLPMIFSLGLIILPALVLLLPRFLWHSCAAAPCLLSRQAVRGNIFVATRPGIDFVVVANWIVLVVATWPVIVFCLPGLIFVVLASWPVDVATWPAIS